MRAMASHGGILLQDMSRFFTAAAERRYAASARARRAHGGRGGDPAGDPDVPDDARGYRSDRPPAGVPGAGGGARRRGGENGPAWRPPRGGPGPWVVLAWRGPAGGVAP